MKYILCVSLWVISYTSKEQTGITDTLSKYCYYLFGYKISPQGAYTGGGSAFFIRNNNKLFLITALHVLDGCKDQQEKDIYFPDTIYVFIEDATGNIANKIPIDIRKIKDTTPCISHRYTTDFITIEIENNNQINSVEKFIYPIFKETDSIKIFGFPSMKNRKGGHIEYALARA